MKKATASYTFITPLNAVRFLAAIAIVIYHYGRWSWPFSLSVLQPYVLNANTGVTLFFVLSGFIMVHVYGKTLTTLNPQNIQAFYRARLARIVPLYIVALLLTVWSFSVTNETWSVRSLLFQLFFLQAWIPKESLLLNFTGWSLSVEFLFYAIFPFCFARLQRLRSSRQFVITGAFWLISNLIMMVLVYIYFPDVERANSFIKFFPLLHVNSFLIGMLAGMWFSRSKQQVYYLLILAALFILGVFPFLIPPEKWSLFHNDLLAPAFAILIIALARSKHRFTKMLASRSLILGGDISYGIYILQVPVYNWVYFAYKRLGIFESLHEEGRFFLYLALLCVASWVSLNTIERWGKKLIRG